MANFARRKFKPDDFPLLNAKPKLELRATRGNEPKCLAAGVGRCDAGAAGIDLEQHAM